MPRQEFIRTSVADAGPAWIERFDALAKVLPSRLLGNSKELPVWLRRKPNYSIWNRSNLWMLQNALVNAGQNATVIALRDGNQGDGTGETEHMVREATNRGARAIRLDTHTAFGT